MQYYGNLNGHVLDGFGLQFSKILVDTYPENDLAMSKFGLVHFHFTRRTPLSTMLHLPARLVVSINLVTTPHA
jgi:hypothetical protein